MLWLQWVYKVGSNQFYLWRENLGKDPVDAINALCTWQMHQSISANFISVHSGWQVTQEKFYIIKPKKLSNSFCYLDSLEKTETETTG